MARFKKSGKHKMFFMTSLILTALALVISITAVTVCLYRVNAEKKKEAEQLSSIDDALYSTVYIDDVLMKTIGRSVKSPEDKFSKYNGPRDFTGCESIAKEENYELSLPYEPDMVEAYFCYLDDDDKPITKSLLCSLQKEEWIGDPPIFRELEIEDNVITCDFRNYNAAIVICAVYGSIKIYHAVLVK